MADVYEAFRVASFIVLFISFLIGVYKAVRVNVEFKYAFNPDRFMNMCWTILALFGLGEVLLQDIEGGIRVFLTTLVCLAQLYTVIFFYKPMKQPEPRV